MPSLSFACATCGTPADGLTCARCGRSTTLTSRVRQLTDAELRELEKPPAPPVDPEPRAHVRERHPAASRHRSARYRR